jgi:hypothetical protein
MLCDAIDECAAKTASALQSLSTNHDPPPPAFQLTHSFDNYYFEIRPPLVKSYGVEPRFRICTRVEIVGPGS